MRGMSVLSLLRIFTLLVFQKGDEMPVLTTISKNTMTTLGDVSERIDELSRDCHDAMIPTEKIAFESLEKMYIGSTPHKVRPVAQMEIAFRLGIPLQYLRRCPESLQCDNLNHWIQKERNAELFIRFDGDDVRAIFTPKYKPIDHFELLERLDALGYGPDTKVQCHLDGEFMLLNIPDAAKTFEINKDAMTPGISISNSEVGLSSVTVAAYILRLICTNGLIGMSEVASNKYRHVSRRILDELPDAIRTASNEINEQKRQLKFSIESRVDDPVATIERFNREFQLGKEEREAVDWGWMHEMGPAMFHIIQTYTKASQYEGLKAEEGYRLQRVGGSILGMVN